MSNERTYGYTENAGAWSIDLGLLNPASPQLMNEVADKVTAAFLDAFADVCTVEYAEGDIAELGDDGRLVALWPEIPLEQVEERRFRPAEGTGVENLAGRAFLSRVMLACGVKLTSAGGDGQSVGMPDGLYVHYQSGLNGLIGEPTDFDPAYVRVDVEVDPWLDATLHDGRVFDNRPTAALNRPRLEDALRRLEERFGRPINYVTSNAFPTLVDRYGFKSGVESYLK